MDARKGLVLIMAGAFAIAMVPATGGDAPATTASTATAGAMPAFANEQEFEALLARWRAQSQRQRAEQQKAVALMAPGTVAPMPAPAPVAEASTLDSVTVVGTGVVRAEAAPLGPPWISVAGGSVTPCAGPIDPVWPLWTLGWLVSSALGKLAWAAGVTVGAGAAVSVTPLWRALPLV